MTPEYRAALESLEKVGWRVELRSEPWDVPSAILSRYAWVPDDVWRWIRETTAVVSPDEKAWFLTGADFAGVTDSAYAWDEWERQSLEAARGDDAWSAEIRRFWDAHLPLALSIRNGYAYIALEQGRLAIVAGNEPEFEETTEIAESMRALMAIVVAHPEALARWL